jgi:tetratricopeptide (TPR) repeat protein
MPISPFNQTSSLFSALRSSALFWKIIGKQTAQSTPKNLLLIGWLILMCQYHALGQTLDPDLGRTLNAVEMNVLGKKQPGFSTAKRLDTLEKNLAVPHPGPQPVAKTSPKYRMSQLLAAQQATLDQSKQQAAIKAYNRGIDASNHGNADAAMAEYQQAIQLNPGLIPAYNNLANLQEKIRLFNEAIGTYENALRIAPQEPLLHFNLAIIMEKQGHIPEAYEHYREYVKNSPNPKPQVVELVKNYDARRNAGKLESDYSRLATQESHGEQLTWPAELLPVPVCIQLADPGQAMFIENIYQDLGVWTQVSNNRIRFREVGYPDLARIVITLKQGPLMDANQSIGHASFSSQALDTEFPIRSLKVSIIVNTGDAQNSDLPAALRKQQVEKLVLHELGHAIGIWGHSKDPDDIMYTHPIVSRLSQRDINTVRKLYGLPSVN